MSAKLVLVCSDEDVFQTKQDSLANTANLEVLLELGSKVPPKVWPAISLQWVCLIMADNAGKKRSQLSGSGYQKGEEQSGFKPYSKKHGMPISSLPPSKRFAATTNIDRPLAVKPQGFQGLYTPFGSFNAQGNKMFPAAK